MENIKYDCIVIGGGIGGLLSANILASNKMNVLIIEQNSFIGGSYGEFHFDGKPFNYAVDYVLGFEESSPLKKEFRNLGISMDFKQLNNLDLYLFPDFKFILESDYKKVIKSLNDLFPEEIESISYYFNILRNLYGKLNSELSEYLDKDYFFFLDSIFSDQRLKAILSARVFSSDVNTLTMLIYLRKLIFNGLFQNEGKKNLALLLRDTFLANNGTIIYNTSVKEVIVKNNLVKSVSCENGRYFEANHYISACDMKKMFLEKVNSNLPHELKHALQSKSLTLSSISMFLIVSGLPEALGDYKVGRLYIYDSYNIKSIYKKKECGILDLYSGIKINFVDVLDVDFKDKKLHKLRIEYDINYNVINKLNTNIIAEELLFVLYTKLGFREEDIINYKIMTPDDFEALMHTTNGAASGWNPNSFFNSSLFEDNIATNFYQTGCWDKYGSGILPIYASTMRVVNKIKNKKDLL